MSVIRIQTPGGTQLPKGIDLDEDYMLKTFGTTLREGFMEGFKVLKPIECSLSDLPDPEKITKNSPIKRLIVGVSGVSTGGKTTMAKALTSWLGRFGETINQDDYYKPPSELPMNTFTGIPEFDEPESLRMDKIIEAVKKWKEAGSEEEEPRVLVVEGTMIFTSEELAMLCDLRYHIHVDFETAEYRRSLRNYKIPDPPLVVAKHIWPKYIKHRKIARSLALKNGFIFKQINGTKCVEHILAGIIQDVAVSKHR